MNDIFLPDYESFYYSLWELSCRFSDFVTFRVIGRSHDKRMIPMLEIGTGDRCFICISGLKSRDYPVSATAPEILYAYGMAFEQRWQRNHFYPVRRLLTQIRLIFIPLLNPDGYEICRGGYSVIRDPALRQMLRTEYSNQFETYDGNGRGNLLDKLFLQDSGKVLLMENENRALCSIVKEYPGEGLLHLTTGNRFPNTIFYCKDKIAPVFHSRSRRMVSGLRHLAGDGQVNPLPFTGRCFPQGSLESYYMNQTHNPSICMETSMDTECFSEVLANCPLECVQDLLE